MAYRLRFVLLIVPFLLAGRPVFTVLRLEEVVERSDVIALVAKDAPFKEQDDCRSLWRFKVLRVIKGGPLDEEDKTLVVSDAGSASEFDCRARKSNSSGVSFPAERYEGSLVLDELREGQNVLVFLKRHSGWIRTSWSFVSLGSIDSEMRLEEVETILQGSSKKHKN